MSSLYVTEQGAQLQQEYERVLVVKDEQVLMSVPLARVSQVVLVGRIGVTTPLLHALLREGIGLLLLDQWGRVQGRLQPPTDYHLTLRHQQYQATHQVERCLAVARSVAAGKLRNYRTLARRFLRGHPEIDSAPLQRITHGLDRLAHVGQIASVRGLEGASTRAYFALFRQVLAGEWSFNRRQRRPPPDPINALLSLGYTLLAQNCVAACEAVGLDPFDGFYHSDKYGRPALALDLMEEFRGIIVDSVVLNLVNRRMLTPRDFQPGPEGRVYLKPKKMRAFFRRYAARLQTVVVHPQSGHKLSYQKCLEVQARLLRKYITGESSDYLPFLSR